MSRFSGKCDLADVIEIHEYTDEDLDGKVDIYVGDANAPLDVHSIKELIPYYPYIVAQAGFNNVDKSSVICLSSESWVDIEERSVLESYRKQLLRIYNKCKRDKVEFDVNDAVSKVCWMCNKRAITKLAYRIQKYGKKANINGVHLDTHEYYRENLVGEMLNNGLNPADYGYGRFIPEGSKTSETRNPLGDNR